MSRIHWIILVIGIAVLIPCGAGCTTTNGYAHGSEYIDDTPQHPTETELRYLATLPPQQQEIQRLKWRLDALEKRLRANEQELERVRRKAAVAIFEP